MSTHKKILTITGAVLSMAVVLALPLMNGFKSSLYSILADFTLYPTAEISDGEGNSDVDQFGLDVDVDGNYAIVGARLDDNNGYSDNGAAYIFYNDPADSPDMGWVQQKKLSGPYYSSAYFGHNVGIDGTNGRAIVGAPNCSYGTVYVYEINNGGENNWGPKTPISNIDYYYGYNNGFGSSVDISGDYAIIGYPNYTSSSYYYSTGKAYILKRDQGGNWAVYKTMAPENYYYLYFGSSVAIDGDHAIVSEHGFGGYSGYNYGKVYLYDKNSGGLDNWGSSISYTGNSYDYLGYDVDIDGNYAIAGAMNHSKAYIYRYNVSSWSNEYAILSSNYYFGKGVAINDVGDGTKAYAVIGDGNGNAYMYSRNANTSWDYKSQVGSYYNYISYDKDGIGMSGAYIITGSYDRNSDGRAYITGYSDCGNGITEAPVEQCDDGGMENGDGCSSTCQLEICGDGIIQSGRGEECDDGGESAACNVDCTLSACSDGTLNITAGELCDDGNLVTGDGCDAVCQPEGIGCYFTSDQIMEWGPDDKMCANACQQLSVPLHLMPPYPGGYSPADGSCFCVDKSAVQCDALAAFLTDQGHTNLVHSYDTCGNEIEETGEACDDGNLVNGDGCDQRCQIEPCGNGVLEMPDEQCDDGGFVNGDGCSSTCKLENGGWGNENKVAADDGARDDNFGNSVSISGDYAIVGSQYDDVNDNGDQGSAYIFENNGGTWSQIAKLTADDGSSSDQFGSSVFISGDYAIVGAQNDYIGSYYSQGSAYVFENDGGTWSQIAKLTADDGSSSDNFGSSVSISGDYAVIGAQSDYISYDGQGSAYIFENDGQTWNQTAKLTAGDGRDYDRFGYSVSISGDTAIIGSQYNDVNGNYDQGSAYIFEKEGESWNQTAKLTASDGMYYDNFGRSVYISGDYAIAGSQYNDVNGNGDQGAAYLFVKPVDGWEDMQETAKLTASDGSSSDQFGQSVSISGDTAIVGTPSDDIGGYWGQGSVYMFQKPAEGWSDMTQSGKFTASDGMLADQFGTSVSIFGNYIIAGAVGSNNYFGSAYIYDYASSVCGDDILRSNEGCEPPGTAFCDESCNIISGCGNGVVDEGEDCDSGGVSGNGCSPVCLWEMAGCYFSSVTFTGVTESACSFECVRRQYLTGGFIVGDHSCVCIDNTPSACTTFCGIMRRDMPDVTDLICGYTNCGNGVINTGEECDDGNINNDDGCDYQCQREQVCGDGFVDDPEQCDDENLVDGDGCSSACKAEGTLFEYAGGGTPEYCDSILSGEVCLWRQDGNSIINNTIGNDPFDPGNENVGLQWACGKCGSETSAWYPNYAYLSNKEDGCMFDPVVPQGKDICLYAVNSDYYYNIHFIEYGMDNGSFSYVRSVYDTVAPEAITDFSAGFGGQITMDWSTPDGTGSRINRYEIRISDSSINNETAWNNAGILSAYDVTDYKKPGDPDSQRLFIIPDPGTYYLAIRSYDEGGNISGISNSPTITVPDKPVITGVTPSSGTNDGDVLLTITGENFDQDRTSVILSGGGGYYQAKPDTNNGTTITFTVSAGMPPAVYDVYVNNVAGLSAPYAEGYTSLAPETGAPPSVTDVFPSAGPTDADTDITILGENFTGATDVTINRISLDINNVTDTEILATVPSGMIDGTYDVIVTTPNGSNPFSLKKYTVSYIIEVTPGTTDNVVINPNQVMSLSGFDGAGSTRLHTGITLSGAFGFGSNMFVTSIEAQLPAGTGITSGGEQYTGMVYPPRIVSKEEALDAENYDDIGPNSFIFEMGSPTDRLEIDPPITVQIQAISSNGVQPIIWYYNRSEGTFELAGIDGDLNGIHYVPGGTVMNHTGNTYTMGLLLSHMSAYVSGVSPSITNVSPSSGAAGTAVTISGTNFHPDAAVTVGGQVAPAIVDSTTSIRINIPGSLAVGSYTVTVTNPDILSAMSDFTVISSVIIPAGGGGGGGGISMGQLLAKKKTEVKPETQPVVQPEEPAPVTRPAAPTVSHVVTTILSAFKDIKNHWAEAYINSLYSEGIITGKTDTKFAPDDKITRAEVLKIALGAFNYEIPSRLTYDPFPDVKMTDWVAPYAQVAREQGIIKGFPEGMRPNEYVSRAEALKILLTASKLPLQVTSTKNFTDTSPGAWYMYYVRYAYENGIIAGYSDGSFRPSATITRAEIAKITVKIMDLVMQ